MKLRLKQLAFDQIHFEISKGFEPDEYSKGRFSAPMDHDFVNAEVSINFGVSNLDRKNFEDLEAKHFPYDVHLAISGKPKPDKSFPYSFRISVSALFFLEDDVETSSDEERIRWCRERGVRLLVGPIREMLVSISSRSYFGDVMIPEINVARIVRNAAIHKKMDADEAKLSGPSSLS